jgi:hypothetical protein
VALDDKTAQTMVASQPTSATPYCPECGQPVVRLTRSSSGHVTTQAWWPGVLAVLGLYLAVTFGPEASGSQRLAAARLEDLREAASWCTRSNEVDPKCSEVAAARGLDPVLAHLARYAVAEGEARRTLAVALGGVLSAVVGVAAATRSLSDASDWERPSARVRVLRRARDILALGARALIPGAQLLLAASCSLAIARLLRGSPPSAELVAWSIHRTIELIVAVVENA